MKNVKIDWTTIMSIAGAVIGLAGTLVGGIASDKKMKAEIESQVAKAISKKH